MKWLLLLPLTLFSANILHLSFHDGCIKEIDTVMDILGHKVTTFKKLDTYDITHEVASELWNQHKEYFESFDLIITSDTAPLSRIFLQNGCKVPLIIWVCNRFNYRCEDPEFYEMLRHPPSHVQIFSYTPFEDHYARCKDIHSWSETITPTGLGSKCKLPKNRSGFFVPPYTNDRLTKLLPYLENHKVEYTHGRYGGARDLTKYQGIIHIPYAWSNLALWENLQNECVTFIPTIDFLQRINNVTGGFFFSPPLDWSAMNLAQWYQHPGLFIEFNSWPDLLHKLQDTDYKAHRKRIRTFIKEHTQKTLIQWKRALSAI